MKTEIRYCEQELARIAFDTKKMVAEKRENLDKIQLNKQLPYLVAHVVEVSWFSSF